MDRSALISLAEKMLSTGAAPETVIVALRMEGASQGECALALGKTGRWSVRQVKDLVDGSTAWADQAASRKEFIQTALDILNTEHE